MCFKLQKEKQGQELIEEAKKLGVAISDIYTDKEFGASDVANARLQERVRNAKITRYARLTWIIAMISAIASLLSALAAWFAFKIN